MFALSQPRGEVSQHARDSERGGLHSPRGLARSIPLTRNNRLEADPLPRTLTDIEHFMAHEAIEAQEEERIAEFTGQAAVIDEETPIMPEGGVPESQILFDGVDHTPGAVDAQSPELQGTDHVGGKDEPASPPAGQAQAARHIVEIVEDSRPAAKVAEEKAREERRAFAEAQAKKFGRSVREAGKRGQWGEESFARPKDAADRLRKSVPYKFKMKKSWWGEF